MNDIDIFVINLDKDRDRLNKITRNLSPHFFTRIPGVYGNDLNVDEYDEIVYTSKYLVPKSTIGCAMSHRKALQTFLRTSNKPYALILEDDAEPIHKNYMSEVVASIQNAPPDWEIIKLDYQPNYNVNTYNKLFSIIATAYIINKSGAEKFLRQDVVYHIDFDMNFYDLTMYNNPTIVFKQVWDENNHSNNRTYSLYNPFSFLHEAYNFKMLRILNNEYTYADILLFISILTILIVLFRYRTLLMQYTKKIATKTFR
jgi:GR25 family glycosyltransferase involved in LPS biosynthesis